MVGVGIRLLIRIASFPASVIIDNLHIEEIVFFHGEADSVLIIDPNAVLSYTRRTCILSMGFSFLYFQGLQPIRLLFPLAPAKQILNIFDYVWWLLVF